MTMTDDRERTGL